MNLGGNIFVWIVLAGLAFFMLFFTIFELNSEYELMLEGLWVAVMIWCGIEATGIYYMGRQKPGRREADTEHEERVKRIMRGRGRRRVRSE